MPTYEIQYREGDHVSLAYGKTRGSRGVNEASRRPEYGVTGSREARPQYLVDRLKYILVKNKVWVLHHGDCVGWDQQAHEVAKELGIYTVSHPPINNRFRAHCKASLALKPKAYIERNKDIVNACEFIIAAPNGPEAQRSGTWSTVRYAKKVGVPGVVLPWGNS